MSGRLLDNHRSAVGLLKALLAGCLLLPLGLFGLASWLNYDLAMRDAFRGLERIADVGAEHAAKVFEGQDQVRDRVADLLHGMDAADIKQAEKRLHDAFAAIVFKLPGVESVIVASAQGDPLVSAAVFPLQAGVKVTDRDYFDAIVRQRAVLFITAVQIGHVLQKPFFGLAQPWFAADGSVAGVIDVAVSPSLFEEFYAVLSIRGATVQTADAVALVREDGQFLVRSPPMDGKEVRAARGSDLMLAFAEQSKQGRYLGRSLVDAGEPRLFAYRKVQNYPVYVVAGRSRSAVVAVWVSTMSRHLVFGVPATLALLAITWTALVRTRREEAALARAQEEIIRREKAEEALLRAQRLEAVGQMTGGVAHDFNNLLTIILGSAEAMARRPGDTARVQRIAAQIMLAAKRGGEITQQLLAFSRRQFVNNQTVDLNACLLEFHPLLQRASNESIRVALDLQPGLCPARLDPGHFEAAILNLVGNARDAMPGGGTITISTRTVSLGAEQAGEVPQGDYAEVGVQDTGIGMDGATAAKAFEPFFTTKGVGRGTGLGLSQVYGFAKQAGGDAFIRTAPGAGTTVTLLLPQTSAGLIAQTGGAELAARAVPGEVVLVVEDEAAVLATTVESLRDLGYATVTAGNAQAALDRLMEASRVDVLFSDITMPGGMNGLELAARARQLRPALKVLLTSGYTTGGEGRVTGVPLLTKPYDRTQLAQELRAVLHGSAFHATMA